MPTGDNQPDANHDLDSFRDVPEDQGLSLDELSGSLANLVGGEGSDPYTPADEDSDSGTIAAAAPADHEAACPVSPLSILEAMLFVGHPEGEPITNRQVAALMRGVRAEEVDDLVRQLNERYDAEGCVYHIQSVESGYCLQLREEWQPIQENFYGKVREAKLSQGAVDALAIVAYHQPVERDEVERLRREPSGRILTQLVRRQLLRVELADGRPRRKLYHTTDRFLDLFGIESLEELPQSQDFDRR